MSKGELVMACCGKYESECRCDEEGENMELREQVADYFSRMRYTTLEEARGTIGEAGDYRHADQILDLIKQAGYVKKIGEIREIPRGGAADSEAYIAAGVGISWERNTDLFRLFKEAGYVQVEQ